MVARTVIAYSGSRDASVATRWLVETRAGEVITVTLDLHGGRELEAVRERALAAGAVRAHVLEVREEFSREYLLPALRADALCGGGDPLPAALARLLIAEKLVHIARIEHASAVAHAAADGQARGALEAAVRGLDASIAVIAPVPESGLSETDRALYARERDIPESSGVDIAGTDAERRGAVILAEAPTVEIAFEAGTPVALNGVAMAFAELLANVAIIDRASGIAGSAAMLHAAHRELQDRAIAGSARSFGRAVSREYRDVVQRGMWFTPLREALDAYVERMQVAVTGTVRVDLSTGDHHVVDLQPGASVASAGAGHAAMRDRMSADNS